jgi:hypothetical protein
MTVSVGFALAGPDDEADIRRMLRDNPLGGAWQISLEREPNGFGGPRFPGERRHFVLARDTASSEVIGLCERLVRPAFVGGRECLLPYLGALRVAGSHRHRIAIPKGGFAMLRNVEREDECGFALTSIAADNSVARRLLTAGIEGLPTYRPAGEYVTLMMRATPSARQPGIDVAQPDDLAEVAAFLRGRLVLRQFAPAWTAAALARQPGLTLLVLRRQSAIAGVVGVWDQRATRLAVLRGLPPRLSRWRHAANLAAPLLGWPAIPAPGETIAQAFLSCLAVRDDDPDLVRALVRAGASVAARAGCKVATIGLPARHSWWPAIRRSGRGIEYRTELFVAYWPKAKDKAEDSVAALDLSQGFPDVALL